MLWPEVCADTAVKDCGHQWLDQRRIAHAAALPATVGLPAKCILPTPGVAASHRISGKGVPIPPAKAQLPCDKLP